jgi:hypothetical protein
MFASQCTKFRLNKGFSHSFDPLSGWCTFGCGNREDGRIISRDGKVIEKGPDYTGAELEFLSARSREIVAARAGARR